MLWSSRYRNIGRVAVLMALLLAIMGPWFYNLDGVPPPEWCRAPFILLDNAHCVELVSGATAIAFMTFAFINLTWQLVTGAMVLPDRARELIGICLIMVSICLLILPFLSTLLLIRRGNSRRLKAFHVIAWGLAALVSSLSIVFELTFRSTQFWGIWLYIGLAVSMLLVEMLALVTDVQQVGRA